MANQASNRIKYLLATKAIDFANDQFKVILMQAGFVFDKDAHEEYADVSGNELATANGYTQKAKILVLTAPPVEDDVDDRCEIAFNAVSWTAALGSIGPTDGAIIIDETVANDPIVGYLDFGASYTQADGGVLTLSALEVRIS